jgi:drug/metabolite transporter (DMT)-like permease
MVLIIILYALFASSFTMGKILLNYTTPGFLLGMRMFIAGIILLTYQYFFAHEHFRFKKKHLALYAQIVILGICITYYLRFWSLQSMPSSKAAFLYNFAPFATALYSYFFFQEKLTRLQWLGLSIGFLGLIPILISTSPAEAKLGEWFYLSWPEVALLCSVATHSYSWIVVRKLIRDKSYSPMMVNGLSMTTGGFIALVASMIFDGFFPVTKTLPFIGWLFSIILISNIICYNLYGYLLKKYTNTFLSFAGFLSPLFAAVYGWALLHETITWHFYLSAAIVFIGLLLFYKDELAQQQISFD